LNRLLLVSEKVENEATEISLVEANRRNPAATVGDFIAEPLPPIDFGRIAAQNAKQVIVQKVRDAERERMYDEFKDRIGQIVNGTVKRVEYGNVIVDLGRGEAIVRRDEALPRETFRPGDRVRAYVFDVRREQRGCLAVFDICYGIAVRAITTIVVIERAADDRGRTFSTMNGGAPLSPGRAV
jgi:N utilization substance protein A